MILLLLFFIQEFIANFFIVTKSWNFNFVVVVFNADENGETFVRITKGKTVIYLTICYAQRLAIILRIS